MGVVVTVEVVVLMVFPKEQVVGSVVVVVGSVVVVLLMVRVQRGHLRVGHELGDGYAWYVSCVGVVGFMYSFRWGHVY